MIEVLAAAALLVAEPTPYEMGRASFFVGACSSLGWDGSRERAVAYAEAYDARHPTDDMNARQTEIMQGIQAARADFDLVVAAFRETADVPAFKEAIAQRCDAVVRDIPGMLGRTDSTKADFDAAVADLVGRIVENNRAR